MKNIFFIQIDREQKWTRVAASRVARSILSLKRVDEPGNVRCHGVAASSWAFRPRCQGSARCPAGSEAGRRRRTRGRRDETPTPTNSGNDEATSGGEIEFYMISSKTYLTMSFGQSRV